MLDRFGAPVLLAFIFVAPLVLGACDKPRSSTAPAEQDSVDELTRALLVALQQNDAAALVELTSAELAGELDERARTELGRTLVWLGGVERLEQLDEREVVDGIERRYRVHFVDATSELVLTAVQGKVVGFEFDDPSWSSHVERAASIGDLRVAEFAFTGAEGQPIPAPLDPAAIGYSIAIEGLASNLREHEVSIGKVVLDSKGNQVYRQSADDQIRFPEAEVGASGGRITGNVAVPGPGEYELELRITDLVAGEEIVHRERFVIAP